MALRRRWRTATVEFGSTAPVVVIDGEIEDAAHKSLWQWHNAIE